MAHSALVSGRFRKRSITSSSSSNIIGHEPFKKSIQPSLRNTAHISTRNTSGISCARSYRTLRDGSFEGRFTRHFVPGYDRCCPYGTRLQTFRNSIFSGTGVRYSTRTKSKLQFIQLVRVHRVMTPVPGEHPVRSGVTTPLRTASLKSRVRVGTPIRHTAPRLRRVSPHADPPHPLRLRRHCVPQVSCELIDVFRSCVPGAHQASAATRADVRIKTPPQLV